MERFEDWIDIIAELDAHADLDPASQNFIINLVEQRPPHLSPKQVAWIEDLKRRYLL